MTEHTYPDEPSGRFEPPPRTFEDEDGRDIEMVAADVEHSDAIVDMYVDFDPDDRAQGIPPVREDDIRDWVGTLLESDCINVVARHGGDVVGHATLVPDGADEEGATEYELAIFVTSEYQGADIGTELLKSLLGRGQDAGVEYVWLTVERWNDPALSVYRSVGFDTSQAESFELEMTIRL